MKITLNELRKIIRNIILENTEGSVFQPIDIESVPYEEFKNAKKKMGEFKNNLNQLMNSITYIRTVANLAIEAIKNLNSTNPEKNIKNDIADCLTAIREYSINSQDSTLCVDLSYTFKTIAPYLFLSITPELALLQKVFNTQIGFGISSKYPKITKLLVELKSSLLKNRHTPQEIKELDSLYNDARLYNDSTENALNSFKDKKLADFIKENKRKRNLLEKRKRLHENLSSGNKMKILDKIYTPGINNLIPMWWRFGHEVRSLADNGLDKELKDTVYSDFDQDELERLCDIMDLLERSPSQNKEKVIEKLKGIIRYNSELEFDDLNDTGLLVKIISILNK